MKKTILLFGMLISASVMANNNTDNFDCCCLNSSLEVEDIYVIELEEEIEIGFDAKRYLPKDFNALKGMHDLDWSNIELIELEEDIELGFNPKKYLPKNFNPYKGLV